jgi:hypothetical protein
MVCPLVVIIDGLPRAGLMASEKRYWIPAFAGMTMVASHLDFLRFQRGKNGCQAACAPLLCGSKLRGKATGERQQK